jgi:hypothetical protein
MIRSKFGLGKTQVIAIPKESVEFLLNGFNHPIGKNKNLGPIDLKNIKHQIKELEPTGK